MDDGVLAGSLALALALSIPGVSGKKTPRRAAMTSVHAVDLMRNGEKLLKTAMGGRSYVCASSYIGRPEFPDVEGVNEEGVSEAVGRALCNLLECQTPTVASVPATHNT